MMNERIKYENMKKLAQQRRELMLHPKLRNLFLELTLRCNECCLHCGSSCGDVFSEELTTAQYREIIQQIYEDFGNRGYMFCITGGEPLLRKDFFAITSEIGKRNISWGMTSNGILISEETANDLYRTGMRTISISLDGMPEHHDAFRQTPGGWEKAMAGIENLLKVGKFQAIQVTTVVTHQNIGDLEQLYRILDGMEIDSWRIINIEPIGRANLHPELLLSKEEYQEMFSYIRNKRMMGEPVCYGCSHYLGMEYEREVRDWYFQCTAGLQTASITASGDIIACLDIERRPEFVQGNILHDRFKDVWENRFQIFRRDLSQDNEKCRNCSEAEFCHGDSFHTWNFDENRPNLCLSGELIMP